MRDDFSCCRNQKSYICGALATPVGHTSRENSETETGLTLGSVFSFASQSNDLEQTLWDGTAPRNGTSLFSRCSWREIEKIMRGDKLCSCALICGPRCEPYCARLFSNRTRNSLSRFAARWLRMQIVCSGGFIEMFQHQHRRSWNDISCAEIISEKKYSCWTRCTWSNWLFYVCTAAQFLFWKFNYTRAADAYLFPPC